MLGLGAVSAILDWTVYIDPCFFEVNRFASGLYSPFADLPGGSRADPGGTMQSAKQSCRIVHGSPQSGGVLPAPVFVPVRYKIVEKMHLTGAAEVLIPLAVVLAISYLGSIVITKFLREDLIR